ncbi:response regulator [Patescibacteria group bacterium]|nr:MAG: response regulator [Patescibacteria group bacterium]
MEKSDEGPKKVWRILIVDDDPQYPSAIRRSLMYRLKGQVVVEFASDGAEGLGKVDASLDILITDYQMPHMNGPELIKLARGIAPHLKVVLMSGDAGAAQRLALAAKDPTIHAMDKPFGIDALLELMAKLMTPPSPFRR